MSRLIVKNLPSGIKEDRVRKIFEERGHVTECCLKYAKDGRFRKFAFIGYKLPEQAKAAVNFLNKSFIDTSQLQVEICKDLCDPEKPRAWSKHSRESSAYQKLMAKNKEKEEEKQVKDKADKKEKSKKKQQDKKKQMGEMLGELKDDESFHEFLEIHKSRVNKATWSNDTVFPQEVADEEDDNTGHQKECDSEDNSDDNVSTDSDSQEEMAVEEIKDKAASKKDLSDLEYLRSKMSSKKKMLSDADSESGSDSSESEDSDKESTKDTDKITQGDTHSQNKNKDGKVSLEEPVDTEDSGSVVKYIIKMRGIPANAKEKQVGDFFRPLKIKHVKIPRNAKGKKSFSTASVEFYTEKDQDQGMGRNKNFMGSKRIYLHKVKVKETVATTEEKPRPWEIKLAQHQDEEEGIAESGRLYVRNLAYCCTEEDIEEHFGQFGPLTEVHVPIDRFTKKMKGFAFVTFMMPEHAVKAYTQLDGSVFQGRMLHILPGRTKKEEEDTEGQDKNSFKKKKEAKHKASASSSHNWNALFLGANAVADAMADKYRTSKSAILDAESGQSLGVRMALGETQLVVETREFLLENGVQLDSFSQPAAARSKTVILVKNLPAGTTGEEIEKVFSRYGTVGRVVLPPSGITAVVEYLEPSEARTGFQNLAYSKFQHVPLYLEWAPMGVFKPAPAADDDETEPTDEPRKPAQKQEADIESESEEDEAEPDTTLFVKNLNFDTTEESLTELFKKVGELACVTISKKKDMKNAGQLLSMGYGFIQFKKRESAQKAIREMQNWMLDGHQLILKVSNRASVSQPSHSRSKKQDTKKKPKSSKILIRNVPFEAKVKEIRQLFGTFGELKSVRLPKKLSGTGPHRGFGFVDFLTTNDAKRAFNALCHSTHLFGRRLVLEWADTEETVDQLRQKTASHFHEDLAPKRLKKSSLLEDLKAMTE